MNKLLILLCSIFFLHTSWAISESGYENKFFKEVWPFFQSHPEAVLTGYEDLELNYRSVIRGGKNALIIMGGRTEPIDKYAELVYDLKDENIDIFLLDSRGQGRSARLLTDPQKGYVEKFSDYAKDLKIFVDKLELKKKYQNVLFLAHSMGGAIGLQAQQIYPKLFDGMVMSAPMIEIMLRDRTEKGTIRLTRILKLLGKKRDYVPGGGPNDSYWTFEENTVTHSLARHNMAKWVSESDRSLLMGSTTVNWVHEALKAGRKIYKKRELLKGIPMLIFQAQKEHFSLYQRQTELCRVNQLCKRVYIFGSKHEVFQEVDQYRDQVISETKKFLKKFN
ncbi:MAG: alpha/beta hydrolase [Oligoflexia bacterium]|nr:alpha/beta hydrolase [Oligoflexia bacterium]